MLRHARTVLARAILVFKERALDKTTYELIVAMSK